VIAQSTNQRTDIVLGLGQLHAAKEADTVLVCLGLGSCIGLSVYDPVSKVGGMAHMVLPSSSEGRSNGQQSPKFVDCAIPLLLDQMKELGALRSRMIIKIVGGAQMVNMNGSIGVLNIGDRNVEATKSALTSLGLPLHGADTGGNHGRTARLFLNSGKFLVSIAGGAGREL
jgi:chemotaxis protein CheD